MNNSLSECTSMTGDRVLEIYCNRPPLWRWHLMVVLHKYSSLLPWLTQGVVQHSTQTIASGRIKNPPPPPPSWDHRLNNITKGMIIYKGEWNEDIRLSLHGKDMGLKGNPFLCYMPACGKC